MEYQDEEYIEIDLKKIMYLLWRNLALIILVTLVSAGAGYAYVRYGVTPVYRASADMLVNNSKEAAAPTVTTSDMAASSNLVKTYSVILKSHTLLEQVIEDLGLTCTYDTLAGAISVSSVDGTQIMRISVQHADAGMALQIVDKIVELAPAAIMDTVDAGSVKTIDAPWTTGVPVSPNEKKYILAAGSFGMLLCLGILILKELLNDTFKSEEEIRNLLGLPVLSVIPLEKEGGKGRKRGGKSNVDL
ncbi:MAG: hypothetical protein KH452_01380 [Clostridiales bacterium]|nr:hypothetical protein [Clostridiales bacterium]